MRGMFRCHFAATAMTLAAIGGAAAQSSVILTSQNAETPAAENQHRRTRCGTCGCSR